MSSLPDLSAITKSVLQNNLALNQDESFLVVTDRKLFPLGMAFFLAGQDITPKARLTTINIPESHGSEPHPDVANLIRKHDVSLLVTTRSLSHTKARTAATENGARIASMPGLTEDMALRALPVDPNRLKKDNDMLIASLDGSTVQLTTELGTDLTFSIKGQRWTSDHGFYAEKGAFGNLPAGEVFIAPVEGTANGKLVIDASVAGLGKVDKPVIMEFEDGLLTAIEGGDIAGRLGDLLESDQHRNLAEFGIGTNPLARITGNVLEDEKVKGTCHLALGNNIHFGGTVDVPFHVDCVLTDPSIAIDGVSRRISGSRREKEG